MAALVMTYLPVAYTEFVKGDENETNCFKQYRFTQERNDVSGEVRKRIYRAEIVEFENYRRNHGTQK
jgi:hypothetical protein